jgi:hypothetical protein
MDDLLQNENNYFGDAPNLPFCRFYSEIQKRMFLAPKTQEQTRAVHKTTMPEEDTTSIRMCEGTCGECGEEGTGGSWGMWSHIIFGVYISYRLLQPTEKLQEKN